MTWLLRLYPRAWRERYGAEIEEVIGAQRPSLQLLVDLLGGAIDARLKPQAFARRLQAETSDARGETDMVHRLKCGDAAVANMTIRESMISGGMSIGFALVLAAVLFATDNELVETILLTMSPGIFVLGVQWHYLRGHSLPARIGLIAAPLVILFLIGLAAGFAVAD